jgi:hypothetical protein
MMSDYRTAQAARLEAAELGRRAGFEYVPVRMHWTDHLDQPLFGAIPEHQYEAHLAEVAKLGRGPNFTRLDEPTPDDLLATVAALRAEIGAGHHPLHNRWASGGVVVCQQDEQPWPCRDARILSVLARSEALCAVAEAAQDVCDIAEMWYAYMSSEDALLTGVERLAAALAALSTEQEQEST